LCAQLQWRVRQEFEPSKERLDLNQLGITVGLLISQIVNFVLLMLILRWVLYGPVMRMLDQRKERIAQSMKDAERVTASAAEAEEEKGEIIEAARREAQEIRAQATRDAERIAQEVRSRAEEDATEIRMKAHEDAERQAANVLAEANKEIAELAILATEQVLGRELADRSEQERFVQEFLADYAKGNA
jgi:F-type H+-transporting ATPase subunit b